MKNGYNRFQVDGTILEMEEKIISLEREVRFFKAQHKDVEMQLTELKAIHSEVMESLSAKEKAAGEMSRIALKEANVIVSTAQSNADTIVKEALITARQILVDLSKLGVEASQMKSNMSDQIETLQSALELFQIPPIPDVNKLDKK